MKSKLDIKTKKELLEYIAKDDSLSEENKRSLAHDVENIDLDSLRYDLIAHAQSAERPTSAKRPTKPPPIAEWLIAFGCSRSARQSTLGDMHRDFVKDIERVGIRQARRLYRAEAMRSTLGAIWQIAKAYLKFRLLDRFTHT